MAILTLGEYRLAGNQSMVRELVSCAGIDSALERDQSILLNLAFAKQPGESLQLAAIICTESLSAFNSAYLGDNQ